MTARFYFCAAALLLAAGCTSSSSAPNGTDAGAGGQGGTSAGAAAGAGSGATGGAVGGAGGSGGGQAGGGAGAPGGAAGACAGPLEFKNDSLDAMGQAAFQGGFASGECWASTYDASALDCSYAFSTLRVLVGGAEAAQTFRIEIWGVDETGKPAQRKKQLGALLQGSDSALNEIDIKELTEPLFQDSAFAVAVCLTEHSGPPAIARDADGIQPAKNWIFDGATWKDAGSLGVQGDWIMRVGVTPK